MVEQGTHKPKVVGSKPTLAIFIFNNPYLLFSLFFLIGIVESFE